MGVRNGSVSRGVGVSTAFDPQRAAFGAGAPQRIAVIGQMVRGAEPNTTEDPVEVSSLADLSPFGEASPLYATVEALLDRRRSGWAEGVPITAYPLKEQPGQTQYSCSVQFGTPGAVALEESRLDFIVGGVNIGPIPVHKGWDAATIALAILLRIEPRFPTTLGFVGGDTVVLPLMWSGSSALGVWCEARWIKGGTGLPITVTQMGFGSGDLDPTAALDRMGERPFTMVINADVPDNVVARDAFKTWGEGRWVSDNPAPAVVFMGANEEPATLPIPSGVSGLDRTNAVLLANDTIDTPWEIAAVAVGQSASQANANPARDFQGIKLDKIRKRFGSQGTGYARRNELVELGIGSAVRTGSSFWISDLVTAWEGSSRAFSSVSDIVKLQNVIHRLRKVFAADGWIAAPFVPDGQTITAIGARQPKAAESAILTLLQALSLEALIVDLDSSRDSVSAEVSTRNPKRLDVSLTIAVSGSAGIVSVDLGFGFFFGG